MARGEFGPLSGSRQASKSGCDSSARWGNRPPARTRAGIARSRLRYTANAGRASGHDLSLAVAGTGREICAELARGECDHGVRDLRPVNESGGAGSQPLPGEGCRKKCVAVTSDYHTRRAVVIFRHEIPRLNFSVAAAHAPREFGVNWWQHREWAKTNFNEWMKLVWWEAVDRWR